MTNEKWPEPESGFQDAAHGEDTEYDYVSPGTAGKDFFFGEDMGQMDDRDTEIYDEWESEYMGDHEFESTASNILEPDPVNPFDDLVSPDPANDLLTDLHPISPTNYPALEPNPGLTGPGGISEPEDPTGGNVV